MTFGRRLMGSQSICKCRASSNIVSTNLICVSYVNTRVTPECKVRAGVCRPCDTIELTATSCNFSLCRRVEKVDRQLLRYS